MLGNDLLYDLFYIYFHKVMEEFYNIFGPELKSVTGDPKRIDDVLARVEALVVPFENVSFIGKNLSINRAREKKKLKYPIHLGGIFYRNQKSIFEISDIELFFERLLWKKRKHNVY